MADQPPSTPPEPADVPGPPGPPLPGTMPQDPEVMAESALAAAAAAVSKIQDEADGGGPRPFETETFDRVSMEEPAKGLDLLADVNLNVKIELGRTRMLVEDVLRLSEGAVVELDKLAGDPVDVYVNERHIARGEVLVLNDNFCVRINEIIQNSDADGPPKRRAM
jgi:flagellar motor switch protein FliN